MGSRGAATAVGFCAILLWSLLALFTTASGRVPPFQLAAMSFTVGGLSGAATWLFRRQGPAALRQPWPVWALGVGGLFGYHALYFTAIKTAPPAEAGLICYLWPLLIVLLSAFLPGERLRAHYVIGALLGLAGTCILFFGGRSFSLSTDYIPGFAAAFVAAFVWATYSALSRRFAAVPTDAVVGFCLVTALLAAVFHVLVEETVWPADAREWGAILLLGLGPVGAAFYAWDHGVKHGDLRVLGAVSYLAPVLSTVFLVIAGFAAASTSLALAASFITAGGMLAAKDMFLRQSE